MCHPTQYEKDFVNCENTKTPGQLPLYLHFKSLAFCPVCFSLLKMYEPTVEERLFSPKRGHLPEKFMKKGFYLQLFWGEEKKKGDPGLSTGSALTQLVLTNNTHAHTRSK